MVQEGATTSITILEAVIVLFLCYLAWQALYLIWSFTGCYILWRVYSGGDENTMNISPKMRLHVYVCPVKLLDESSIRELFKFVNNFLDPSLDFQEFYKILQSYTFVVLLRERRDGSLRGLFVISCDRCNKKEKSYTVLRLGLSFFEKEYRGGPYFYYTILYFRIKEFFLHPFKPFYIFGTLFSYKSYAILTHNLAHVYPSYSQDTPEEIGEIINDFAKKVKLPGEVYDPVKFVLKNEIVAMKESVSEPGRANRDDPNVKFFIERNPGWSKGHLLFTLSSVHFADIFRIIYRMLYREFITRRSSKRPQQPGLKKQLSLLPDFTSSSKRLFPEGESGHRDH